MDTTNQATDHDGQAATDQTHTNAEGTDAERAGQSSEGADDKRESFDRAYVEKLRKEAAGYRKRAKDLEPFDFSSRTAASGLTLAK